MENPEHDLPRVIPLLTTSKVPTVLHKAIERFYTPDASLRHPFNVIKPGPSSRQIWLGVYEWYRIISPGTVATINGLGEYVYCEGYGQHHPSHFPQQDLS
ncbi:hypothetical protein J3A83DRAFT_968360 [Scleroderma citrinum]